MSVRPRSTVPDGPALAAWLRRAAHLLDAQFTIPGTRIRFGLDPILSLIPGVGELVTPAFAVVTIAAAIRLPVPKVVLVRMLANALVDAALGAIPLVGSIVDLFWRANLANLALLERHAAKPALRPSAADVAVVWGLALAFGLLVAIPVVGGIWATVWLLRWVSGAIA